MSRCIFQRLASFWFGLFALFLVACNGSDEGGGGGTVPPPGVSNALRLQPVATATALSSPLFLTAPPGNTNETRLFVVEQPGRIQIVDSLSGAFIGTFL